MADGVPLPVPLSSPAAPALAYTVQVGAFRGAESARALAARLVVGGYDAFVTSVDLGAAQGIWHRVRVGRFGERTVAEGVAARLAEAEGLPAQVVRDTVPGVDTPAAER